GFHLGFLGPFTEVVTCPLDLFNPSNRSVIFKVKTTVPKRYCVRPNSGIIKSNEKSSVSIMLQPSDTANAEEEKTKHKFMVQSMYVPEEEYSLDTIWKTTDPSEIMDTRLKVVFKPSDEAPHHEEVPTEAVHQEKVLILNEFCETHCFVIDKSKCVLFTFHKDLNLRKVGLEPPANR
ncbi:unnamed protein product, partial [Enterobius vermicularis]|uniref:Major sperm protein n=1 Tax=Enterobius vermicularis TaxID=51028 RepID=A0A0N4UYX8_ENTVE